jgi:hypothetical protein
MYIKAGHTLKSTKSTSSPVFVLVSCHCAGNQRTTGAATQLVHWLVVPFCRQLYSASTPLCGLLKSRQPVILLPCCPRPAARLLGSPRLLLSCCSFCFKPAGKFSDLSHRVDSILYLYTCPFILRPLAGCSPERSKQQNLAEE